MRTILMGLEKQETIKQWGSAPSCDCGSIPMYSKEEIPDGKEYLEYDRL